MEEAAKKACKHKEFTFDAIYWAVLKTKQRYKKLVNKERAVDFCISLMKQPRKHVKESFTSVEDCIEKAMAAKVVPWKPIISAVAIILAIVILVSPCSTGNSNPVEIGGFEMENTLSIANSYSDNGTYLKNFHKVADFGGPDLTELTGTDMTQVLSNTLYYNAITTPEDITYIVIAHLNYGDVISAEFVLYRADLSGWTELARAPIDFSSRTVTLPGQEPDYYYSINDVFLFYDPEGNLYILSHYSEGIQVHQYTSDGIFSEIGKKKLVDKRIYALNSVETRNTWANFSHVYFNNETQSITFVCDSTIPFQRSKGNSRDNPEICFVTFSLRTKTFSEPLYFKNERSYSKGICPDNDGGLYILFFDALDTTSKVGTGLMNNQGFFLYHLKDGALSEVMLISDENFSATDIRMFEVDEDGAIHIVYTAQVHGRCKCYVKIVGNEIVTSYKIPSTSEDATIRGFMTAYRKDDRIYFVELIMNKYILFSWTDGVETKRLAEFVLPQELMRYDSREKMITPIDQGCILNLILSESPVQETYFGQIIFEYEEAISTP
jgi:hypothetical protein